jgi:3-oxoacyl-[acyl-carrier-protein] synthase III
MTGVAVVGAAETTRLGTIPDLSAMGLHTDAALNALADCGLGPGDIDGVACAGASPVELAKQLGITTSSTCAMRWRPSRTASAGRC